MDADEDIDGCHALVLHKAIRDRPRDKAGPPDGTETGLVEARRS